VKHGNPEFPMPAKSCEKEGEIISAKNAEEKNALPNPAAQNCLDKGGKLEYLAETAGTLGICRFDDGTACEEWQFFRGECQKGRSTTPNTAHPYRGLIKKVGQKYNFTTDTGVEYLLQLPKLATKELKARLIAEAGTKGPVTIIAAETPPLSKTLILESFQEK
jgi:putative hemolysin